MTYHYSLSIFNSQSQLESRSCSSARSISGAVLVILILGSLVSTGEAFSVPVFYATFRPGFGGDIALKSSSLNEDGDFCIEGINDDKTIAGAGAEVEEFTSLLDMEYNQIKNSKLSDILQPSSPGDDIRLEDDSNMIMSSDNAAVPFPFLKTAAQAVASPPKGTSNRDVQGTTTPPPLPSDMTTSMMPSSIDRMPPTALPNSADEKDQAAAEALEGFLGSFFDDQVNANDIRRYASALVAIGFDPDCEWSKELEFADLVFMKKLHQRFFWKEWEKLL